MRTDHFKICVKAAGFDIKKMRRLEVLRISKDGRAILDIRYQDIHDITNFRDWFNKKVAH